MVGIVLFGCAQVLGVEEAHVDPAAEARASAGGSATNVAASSADSTIPMISSIGESGGEGGFEP